MLVDGQELGFADVDVVRRFRQLWQVDRDEFVALLDDWVLPIRFRIEDGAILPAETTVVPPTGGTAALPGFGSISFPPGAFQNPQSVTVSATATEETRATFELSARFLSIDTRVAHELRVNTGQMAPTTPTEITLTVPEEFVAALPPGDGAAVFLQLYQDGGQDLLDNFVRLEPAAFDPATSTITTSLPAMAFTDLRRADGTFEAIIVIGSAPEGIGGVLPLKALAAAAQEMCEEALIESPLEGPLVVTKNSRGEPNGYDPDGKPPHKGTDYVAADGDRVLAVADGRIEHIGFNLEQLTTRNPRTGLLVEGWGRYVIVRHDDRNTTLYAHLQKTSTDALTRGDSVLTGELIGLADNTGGSTAPHLHLEYASEGAFHIDPDLCRQPEEDPPEVTASIVPFFTGGPFGGFQSKPGTGVQSTITITFSGPVSSVTITALDPDFAGNRAVARNASGAVVASRGFAFDNTPGEFTFSTVTLTAPGIITVSLIPAPLEYVAYTGLSFVAESSPGTATFPSLPSSQGLNQSRNAPPPVVVGDTVPAAADALFSYLQDRHYQSLPHEPNAHASKGEHGTSVMAYLSSVLDESLRGQGTTHPRRSAAIMEVIGADGTISSWLVSVKTNPQSDAGLGWFWYEVLNTTDMAGPIVADWGVTSCVSCHTAGRDFILSDYPGN